MQSLIQNAVSTTALAAAALCTVIGVSSQARVSATFEAGKTATAAEVLASARPVSQVAAAIQPQVAAVIKPVAPKVRSHVGERTKLSAVEERIRSQLRFETVRWDGKPMQTLDEPSRILLAKAAAEKAGLREVGLSFHDVYGLIEAETSWMQRTGASKDGTPNLGLAQFEPNTAKALGLENPEDPVQAVFAAAVHMKEGAEWASGRVDKLKLDPATRTLKIREGVSVFYNLSVKGRNKWDGTNADVLPIETQRHIRNVGAGAQEAAQLARLLKA